MGRNYDLGKRQDIRRWARDLQREMERELKRHPVRVPIESEPSANLLRPDDSWAPTTVNNYHAPVVVGDGNQIAWNVAGNSSQGQVTVGQIGDGYRRLAEVVTRLLGTADSFGLTAEQVAELRAIGDEVLHEVTTEAPDASLIQRAVNSLRGLLASAALGVSAGITTESAELAKHLIGELGTAL